MMEIELSSGQKIRIATTEIVAFIPVNEGTQIVLRPNRHLLNEAGMVQVSASIGKLVDAYNYARRVT